MIAKLLLPLIMIASVLPTAQECSQSLIPQPKEIDYQDGTFVFQKGIEIVSANENNAFNATYLCDYLSPLFQFDIPITKIAPSSKYILLEMVDSMKKEQYQLIVSKDNIVIRGSDRAGIFYGIQTLMQMMPPGIYAHDNLDLKEFLIPNVVINDEPRYEFRGAMLDVARTFYDTPYILKYIDWLSYHKINKFQWHLTDDNGWRIEIKKYPVLTEKGAWRGENEVIRESYLSGKARYGGFYTQKEIKQVIEYAAQRNIEIIPEIELPGHSRAIIACFPSIGCQSGSFEVSPNGEVNNVWCVSEENNYKILDNIIKEVAKLFPSKYIHIGGDEVVLDHWKNCPDCQALMKREGYDNEEMLHGYFVNRIQKIVEKYGKHIYGWDDILSGDLNPEARVLAWRNKKITLKAIERKQPTVVQLCEYSYFDMKYSPMERGHSWAAIIPLERAYNFDPIEYLGVDKEDEQYILGPQCGLWTELMQWPPRFAEYQLFPRMCAFAELAWTPKELKDFQIFKERLVGLHYDRLYKMGIAFRVDPPKVTYSYDDKILKVELPYPSAVVRYTTDKSDPTHLAPVYQGQIITNSPEDFRFATFYSNDLRSIAVGAENIDIYQYKKPKTTAETNIELRKGSSLGAIVDYDFKTGIRTASRVKKGDYVLYTFEEPVDCKRITVYTGMPSLPFYGVNYGYVEYSYDGETFIKGEEFSRYIAEINNIEKPIKSVKIVVTDENDGYTCNFLDLKIE